MKKLMVFILTVTVLAGLFALSACDPIRTGENPADTGGAKNDTSNDDGFSGNGGDPAGTNGKTHDTGNFSVLIPDGWLEIPFFRNGEYDPDALGIYKGAQNEYGMTNCPGIQIYYPATHDIIPKNRNNCKEVSELTPLELENGTWEGFSGMYSGYPLVALFNNGNEGFAVTVWLTSAYGEETISIDDADVLAIIAGISLGETEPQTDGRLTGGDNPETEIISTS